MEDDSVNSPEGDRDECADEPEGAQLFFYIIAGYFVSGKQFSTNEWYLCGSP